MTHRLLKQYPGDWNIFLTSTEGENKCLDVQVSILAQIAAVRHNAVEYMHLWLSFIRHSSVCLQEKEPSYKELQQLLKDTPSSNSSKPLAERLQAEFKFNRDSIQ